MFSDTKVLFKPDRTLDSASGIAGQLLPTVRTHAVGVPEIDFMFANAFCENDDVVMVMPDYRKSVEAPYPAALDDCMLALAWMKAHADILGINEKQLFVGGESAGGGLACAVTLWARDEGKIPVAFCMPLYPMISEKNTESSRDNHYDLEQYNLKELEEMHSRFSCSAQSFKYCFCTGRHD